MKYVINMYKYSIALSIAVSLFLISGTVAHANIPDIEGYVLVSGTNAPVPNVWVKITNDAATDDNCVPGTINQTRYAKTDSKGKYTFVSWTNGGSSAVGEGKQIDSDLDGKNDVIQYPTFDSCEPDDSPGSIFSCGRDPFAFEVVRPVGWFGTFDSIPKTDPQGNCLFCINNGTFTAIAPTLYYHPPASGSTLTPTRSGSGTPTRSTSGTVTPTRRPSTTPTRSATGSVTPTTQASSCSFTGIPASKNIRVGTEEYLSVGVSQTGGTVDQITFTSDNGSVVSVCKSPLCAQGTSVYRSNSSQVGLTGFVPGQSTTIHITGRMLSNGTTCTPADVTINVTDSVAWCQFKNTDVVTNGSISCQIPPTCTAANGCTNSLILSDVNQTPGVPAYASTISTGSGNISKSPYGWNAKTTYNGIRYGYDYFEKKADGIIFSELSFPRINSISDLSNGNTQEGYYWTRYTGGPTLEITNDIAVGNRKVVLFVDNADTIIKGNINVTKGRGFFMIVTNGNVLVDSSVGGSTGADLEGIYFTEKQFRTGTSGANSDTDLHVRGISVAMDEIVLQRSLLDNSGKPGELLEYGQDQIFLFPARLGERTLNWKEVAP